MELTDERARAADLAGMKRVATGMLVVSALVFIVALRLEASLPWARFVRAAAEGALVGGLADWFAVTALFRRPLGLPIPHTAIIPSRKDAIGASIGRFVQNNFLTPEVVVGRVRAAGPAAQLGVWLTRPDVADRVARVAARGVAGALRIANDSDIQHLIERAALQRLASTPVAPTAGHLLGVVLVGQRRRDLLHTLVQLVAQALDENRAAILKRIGEGTPWWMPRGVDRSIYTRLVETVAGTLNELSQDPDHPLHAQFDAVVERFIDRLQHDPEYIAAGEAYKAELTEHPIVREAVASLWQGAKASLVAQSERDDSALREAIERGVVQVGGLLQRDRALAAKVDDWLEGVVRYAVGEYGDEVSRLIAQTVSRWDSETTARRIELQVGRDLQFIRINGTVVGGLAGVAIYALGLLVG